MSFLATHRKNILSSTPINQREIKPGDMISFTYKTEKGSKVQFVICLDGVTGKLTRDNKLNAVKLENLSMPMLKNFIRLVRKPALILDERNKKQIMKINIEADTETERQVFYKKIVSRFVRYDIYRTYIDRNMTSIRLIEYDFGIKPLKLEDEVEVASRLGQETVKEAIDRNQRGKLEKLAKQETTKMKSERKDGDMEGVVKQIMEVNPGISREEAEAMTAMELGLSRETLSDRLSAIWKKKDKG